MGSYKSYIGRPWITEQLLRYGATKGRQRPAAAQVTEFVLPKNWIKETEHEPAAVIHVSDLKHYIKAVVTKRAKCDLEQEEENYTLSDIKSKIIILRKFNVELHLELQLEDCEFYLVVQELKILPAETGFSEACSCNLDPAVQKKLREFWQSHVNNMTEQTGLFSGLCLSNLIAAVEDEDNSLKSAVELCLDLTDNSKASTSTSSILLPSIHPPTGWKTSSRKDTNKIDIFTIPETMLMISPNQEEVLNNIKEWKDDFVCTEEAEVEVEHNGDIEVLNNAGGQQAASSQNPWNEVLPVSLGVVPSSGETHVSCVSEPCKEHVDKCDDQLPSTFSDSPANDMQDIDHQLPSGSVQDPERSLEMFTDGSQQEQSHSEELCDGSFSHAQNTSAGRKTVRTDVTEPEDSAVILDEGSIEKSLNCSRTVCTRLFKNISPLSVAANNLNCAGLFKNIAPVTLPAGSSHTNLNGGPTGLRTLARNYSTAARNNALDAEEQQLTEEEEPYEILRAVKRKRHFIDSEEETDCDRVEPSTSVKQSVAVNGDQNSWNVSSDETLIGADRFEEITKDVCQMNPITGHDKACRKSYTGRNTVFKDTDLRNITESKMTMVSKKYNKLSFVSEKSSEQVRDCKRQTSSEASIVQPTEDVSHQQKHVLSPGAKQNKVKPLRHPDGSQFLYSYPAPTAELISQVNSVRVPSGLLKWAVSYLTGPIFTQD